MAFQEPVLTVQDLSKIFYTKKLFRSVKPFTAVDNISFQLHKGEILGFLGPNGAGKTTTIQMLLSLMTPTSGNIYYFGKNFFEYRSEILRHVSFASAYVRLLPRLTIIENLNVYGRLYGLSKKERTEKISYFLKFFGLWNMRNKLTGPLSAGEATRLLLAKAFLTDPKIILFDEPTATLDPNIANSVRQFILEQQKKQHISILFTSHNMAEVEEVCDRILVLKKGKIIADNTPEQIAHSIATTRVQLMVGDGLKKTEQYAQEHQLPYKIIEHFIEIQVDEHKIAQLLSGLAKIEVSYSQISIAKPTLEDYFLHIAKE